MQLAQLSDFEGLAESHEGSGYLPFEYLVDFMRFLARNRHVIETITYDDLHWDHDYDPDTMYKGEFKRWRSWLDADPRRKNKIYVLIQLDVDSEPQQSMDVVRTMRGLGLLGNVMIFNRRLNRALLRDHGKIALTDYPIDDDLLRSAINDGFSVGYHTNAVERAQYDFGAALDVFMEDVNEIRSRFPSLRYFSPHGGVPSADAINNNSLPISEQFQRENGLRWVHNKRAPSFDKGFSDGGFANRHKDPNRLDLFAAARNWRAGGRYRVLLHPQYYAASDYPRLSKAENVRGTDWYEDAWSAYGPRRPSGLVDHLRSIAAPYFSTRIWEQLRYVPKRGKFRVIKEKTKWFWRLRETAASLSDSSTPKRAIRQPAARSTFPPIFVRGMSRSGGTLMVTLLDAHPNIAMSYELYPDLLRGPSKNADMGQSSAEFNGGLTGHAPLDLRDLLAILENEGAKALNVLRDRAMSDVRVFLARAGRSGIELPQLKDLVRDHLESGLGVSTIEGRLRFMERISLEKMRQENKQRWGLKCSGQYDEYLSVWPNARFINIIRDGRDVLASQKNTGSFKASSAEVGRAWANTHTKFRQLAEQPDTFALEVHYETLATDTEREIRRICDFLDIPFDTNLLAFHERDLSIYKSPKGHLSIDRISKPIDATKIGRWRGELLAEDLEAFMSEASQAMKLFGYSEA